MNYNERYEISSVAPRFSLLRFIVDPAPELSMFSPDLSEIRKKPAPIKIIYLTHSVEFPHAGSFS